MPNRPKQAKRKELGRTARKQEELVCHTRTLLPRPNMVDVCYISSTISCRCFQTEYQRSCILRMGTLCRCMIGSISGGWFSGMLIRKGKSVDYARKMAIVLGGVIIIPFIIAAVSSTSSVMAIIFMAFVLGGFQFMITNIQTIPSDLHCGKSVGSLAGLGGVAAVLGTIIAILLHNTLQTGYCCSPYWEHWFRYLLYQYS